MPEVNRRWIYPTVTASENKGIERIALSGEGMSHEVIGVDGSRRFGCRPTSGFRLAHTLDIYKDFSGSAARPYSSVAPPTQAKTSTVTDCFPVHFQIREGEYGHGFVYRVKNVLNTNSAIYMDYVPTTATVDYTGVSAATGWRTILISDHSSGAGGHVSSTDKMDVVSMGKYVFVFVQGRQPRVFLVDYDSTGPTYTAKVLDGGPGPRPRVASDTQDQPQFNLDINLATGAPDVESDGSTPSSDAGRSSAYAAGSALQGRFFHLNTGASSPSVPASTDFHLFKPGDYTFAYYLHDSHTGRRTALTEIVNMSEDGAAFDSGGNYAGFTLEIDTDLYDEIYMFRSVKQQSVGGTYTGSILHLDTIYNITDTDIDTEAALNTTNNSTANYPSNIKVYRLYYQLDDIALAMQDLYLDKLVCDDEMPFAGAAVPFENSLIVADPKEGSSSFPVSTDSRIRHIGEMRWSSLTERSPELFPINNKYSPDIYQNRVIRLCRAGDYAIGFSRDRLYHIRRNGIFLKIEEMHAGFGLAGDNGFAMAGPMVYFITRKGLKAVANNGQLDDVKALDNLILEDWYDNIEDLRLSFDPYMSCLFVHNPALEQTVCMWFNTGRVTEIHDSVFDDVRTGVFPQTFSRNAFDDTTPTPTTSTTMVERSFFLQNHPSTTAGNIAADWKPRVYVMDIDRDKVQVNSNDIAVGQPRLRTLDCGGDSIFQIAGITSNASSKTVNLKRLSTTAQNLGGGGSGAKDLVGAYIYVLSAAKSTEVGKKYQIFGGQTGAVSADGSGGGNGNIDVDSSISNLAAGDVIAISPPLFRYVGGALPMIRTKDNQVVSSFDLFQNKQISSLGCHFTEVTGGVTGYKFFKGLVYNTESDSPAVSAFPVDFAGTLIGDSIQTGESDNYAAFSTTGLTTKGRHGIQDSALNPGIEIFCPDLDFKLMALICRGRTTNTDTTERSSS